MQQTIQLQEEKSFVIDRFEGCYAICENQQTLKMENIEIIKLPQNIKEGDVIKFKDNKYEIDIEARKNIESRIEDKMKDLFNT